MLYYRRDKIGELCPNAKWLLGNIIPLWQIAVKWFFWLFIKEPTENVGSEFFPQIFADIKKKPLKSANLVCFGSVQTRRFVV